MFHLYIDESGEFGTAAGSSRHVVIAVLCTETPKALDKRIWRNKARLYGQGWPKHIEIKGTTLWGADHIPGIPQQIADRRVDILKGFINDICASPIKLHYCIANKAHLSRGILNAEYGIAYNYFCGTLLCRSYKQFAGPITMVVDQRSKETHHKLKFDGYIETRFITECDHSEPLSIEHAESHDVPGLQAVDFLSWGLFRHYEHRDSTFRDLIRPAVGYRDDWYSWKR